MIDNEKRENKANSKDANLTDKNMPLQTTITQKARQEKRLIQDRD